MTETPKKRWMLRGSKSGEIRVMPVAEHEELLELCRALVTAWDEKDNNDLFTCLRHLKRRLQARSADLP